jgi:hypothetical protein
LHTFGKLSLLRSSTVEALNFFNQVGLHEKEFGHAAAIMNEDTHEARYFSQHFLVKVLQEILILSRI